MFWLPGIYPYSFQGPEFLTLTNPAKVTTVTNDTYITAVEICELLKKIAVENAGKPIFIVLDNARYQKCSIVQELANQLGIHLISDLPEQKVLLSPVWR